MARCRDPGLGASEKCGAVPKGPQFTLRVDHAGPHEGRDLSAKIAQRRLFSTAEDGCIRICRLRGTDALQSAPRIDDDPAMPSCVCWWRRNLGPAMVCALWSL